MSHLISVTEAVRTFGDIIGRVYYRGEEFDIKKGTQIVAHLGPSKNRATLGVGELTAFFAKAPSLSSEDIKDFENDINTIRNSVGEIKNKWD